MSIKLVAKQKTNSENDGTIEFDSLEIKFDDNCKCEEEKTVGVSKEEVEELVKEIVAESKTESLNKEEVEKIVVEVLENREDKEEPISEEELRKVVLEVIEENKDMFNKGTVVVEGDDKYPKKLLLEKKTTVYGQDDVIDLDDLVVKCEYQDGTVEEIKHYGTNLEDIDTAFYGYKELVVTYCHNGITVSNKIGIEVKNTDSYNGVQLAYKVVKSGLLTNGQDVVKSSDKLYRYGTLRLRGKIRYIIEQNDSEAYTSIGLGNYGVWGTDKICGSILLNPHQVGEFIADFDKTFDFEKNNVEKGKNILVLSNNGNNAVQGRFEIIGLSLTYTKPVPTVPIELSVTKSERRVILGDSMATDDIKATVVYNTGGKEEVIPEVEMPTEVSVGENNIICSYSKDGRTLSTTVSVTCFARDKEEVDPMEDITAREWLERGGIGVNVGNQLDSMVGYTKSSKRADLENELRKIGSLYTGDGYMYKELGATRYQEIAWGQPNIIKKHFEEIKEMGFDMVRIPVSWSGNSWIESEIDENGNRVAKVDENGYHIRHIGKFYASRVREVVDMALESGLYVMINCHHDMPLFYTNAKSKEMGNCYADIKYLWTDIANKFKNYDHRLAFEGFNEVDNLNNPWVYETNAGIQMNKLNQIFVDTVRATGGNNEKRILFCPTLLHEWSYSTLKDYVLPTDSLNTKNKIGIPVHYYGFGYVQDIEYAFNSLEKASQELGAPIQMNEWGTKYNQFGGDWSVKHMHAQNYSARARNHNLYPVFWNDGGQYCCFIKTNIDQYCAVTKEFNYDKPTVDKVAQKMVEGWNTKVAFKVDDKNLGTLTKKDFTYRNYDADKGFYDSGWGHLSTTNPIPVEEGKELNIWLGGGKDTNKLFIQPSKIIYLKEVLDKETNEPSYEYVASVNRGWHEFSYKGEIPTDVGVTHMRVVLTSAENNINNKTWDNLFNEDGLTLNYLTFVKSDIYKVSLENRKPINIEAVKTKYNYALNEELNLDDIKVTINYNDGWTRECKNFAIDTSDVDMTENGLKKIKISATVDGVLLETEVEVFIGKILKSISAKNNSPYSKVGAKTINTNHIVVTAKYSDDSEEEVVGFTVDTSNVDTNVEGEYEIVVAYEEDGIVRTCRIKHMVTRKIVATKQIVPYGVAENSSTIIQTDSKDYTQFLDGKGVNVDYLKNQCTCTEEAGKRMDTELKFGIISIRNWETLCEFSEKPIYALSNNHIAFYGEGLLKGSYTKMGTRSESKKMIALEEVTSTYENVTEGWHVYEIDPFFALELFKNESAKVFYGVGAPIYLVEDFAEIEETEEKRLSK